MTLSSGHSSCHPPFRLRHWRVDPETGDLTHEEGQESRLDPKVMEVLLYLVERRGHVVSHEELLENVWPDTVVTGAVLRRCIWSLRRALDDDPKEPAYIETLARRGYRLISPVELIVEEDSSLQPPTEEPTLPSARVSLPPATVEPNGAESPSVQQARDPEPASRSSVEWPTARPTSHEPGVLPPPTRTPREMRLAWLAAGLAGLALFVAVGWTASRWGSISPDRARPPHVTVGAFDDRTGGRVDSTQIGAAFQMALEESDRLVVLSEDDQASTLQRMRKPSSERPGRITAIEVCLRKGYDLVLVGSVVQVAGKTDVGAEIVEPSSGATLIGFVESVDRAQALLPAVARLARRVDRWLSEFELPQPDDRSGPVALPEVTTSSLAALQAYQLATVEVGRLDPGQALELLDVAVSLDPDFPVAHARRGRILARFGRAEEALRSLEIAYRGIEDVSDVERLYIEAEKAHLELAPDAERKWRLLTQSFPEFGFGHRRLGHYQWEVQNDYEGAIVPLRSAVELEPSHDGALALAAVLLAGQQPTAALETLAVAAREAPTRGLAIWRLGSAIIHMAANDPTGANERLEAVELSELAFEERIRLLRARTIRDVDGGRFEDALRTVREAGALAREVPAPSHELWSLAAEAVLLDALGDVDALDLSIRAAIEQTLSDVRSLSAPRLQSTAAFRLADLVTLGKIAARRGWLDLAQRVAQELGRAEMPHHPVLESLRLVLDGEISLAGDDLAGARAAFAEAERGSRLFQARESLAFLAEVERNRAQAIEHLSWMLERRGQAFVDSLGSSMRLRNVVDWNLGHERIARVLEALGRHRDAAMHREQIQRHRTRGQHITALAPRDRPEAIAGGMP